MTSIRRLLPLVALFLLAAAGIAPVQGLRAAQSSIADIQTDHSILPEQVSRMRAAILEAARGGYIEELRPVLEMNELMPTVSFGGADDPIKFWMQASGDGQGREIMAVLVDILEMPFAHTNPGTPDEMYVWPYLARLPLDKLTPAQQIDLYRLMTPDEVKTMRETGDYIHYRLGIGPDGTWHYFVAGD